MTLLRVSATALATVTWHASTQAGYGNTLSTSISQRPSRWTRPQSPFAPSVTWSPPGPMVLRDSWGRSRSAVAIAALPPGSPVRLLDGAGRLVGLGEVTGFSGLRPRRIFNL